MLQLLNNLPADVKLLLGETFSPLYSLDFVSVYVNFYGLLNSRLLTGFMPRNPRFVSGVERHVFEKE
jgi:hypothetical protein